MRTRMSGAVATLLLIFANAMNAQPLEQAVLGFTVTEAVELALRLNPEILSQREKTEEFGSAVREARAEALPEVSLSLSYRQNRDPGLRNSPFFSRLLAGPDELPPEALQAFFFTNYVWNFDVSQPIYTFGRVSHALNGARQERSGVNLDVQGAENRISFDVVRACYSYLLAEQNLVVLQTERESRQRQLDQVQVRFDLEDATRLDLLRARVALANLAPEILSAENTLQVAQASVNNTLGRDPGAPIEVLAELALETPVPMVLRPEALLELAGQHRPELRRYAVDRQVLASRIGVTRSELKPQIRANAGYGVNTFAADNFTDLGLRTWAFGFSMDWKLFDGFRTRSRVSGLRSQITQKEHDEHAFRNELSVRLKEANGTWLHAVEALEVTGLVVEEAREAQRVAEESLKYGAATTLDVIQSTLALRQAELNNKFAAHDALVALAEMKFLTGFRADAPNAVIAASQTIADSEGSEP